MTLIFCYGLSIEIDTANKGVPNEAHQVIVLMHNHKDFIQFVGRSVNLPRALLKIYGEVNDIKIGNHCGELRKNQGVKRAQSQIKALIRL